MPSLEATTGININGSPVSAANSPGQNVSVIAAGASPFAYTATERGTMNVSGGTVTGVTLTRNSIVVNMGALNGCYSMCAGDILTVTYTAAPALTFIPL